MIFKNIFIGSGEGHFSAFKIMVQKDIQDHIRSWKFFVLLSLVLLTCCASSYSAVAEIMKDINTPLKEGEFLFLKVFTMSNGALPAYYVFLSFLGPLLGISLGFDAINGEYSNRTISRILAQPVYRDVLINSKVLSAIFIVGGLFASLTSVIIGVTIMVTGQIPEIAELFRIISFLLVTCFYVAFWLNLSVLFSIKFSQAATSALTSISIWLFFLVFYPIIINLFAQWLAPSIFASGKEIASYQQLMLSIMRFAPSQLFMDATTALLSPQVRSLGPLSMEQIQGAIPNNLPFLESVKIVWAQITGLIASSTLCFVFSYYSFMRKEVRM